MVECTFVRNTSKSAVNSDRVYMKDQSHNEISVTALSRFNECFESITTIFLYKRRQTISCDTMMPVVLACKLIWWAAKKMIHWHLLIICWSCDTTLSCDLNSCHVQGFLGDGITQKSFIYRWCFTDRSNQFCGLFRHIQHCSSWCPGAKAGVNRIFILLGQFQVEILCWEWKTLENKVIFETLDPVGEWLILPHYL